MEIKNVFEAFSTKHEEQRVGIFVDVQNLYYSARNIYNARVNYSALLKEVVGDRKLIRAIDYVKNFGVRADLIAFGKSSSSRLVEVVDDFIDLDKNPKKFLIPIKK